jgi:hypothetical protein
METTFAKSPAMLRLEISISLIIALFNPFDKRGLMRVFKNGGGGGHPARGRGGVPLIQILFPRNTIINYEIIEYY